MYNKFFVAASGFLVVFAASLKDGNVDGTEAVSIGSAFVAAVGVFLAKNKPA